MFSLRLDIKNFIDKLYQIAKNNSHKKKSKFILFFFSFIESIFFPVPVDPLLAFLVFLEKNKYIKFFLICTFASVIGGLFGWIIGYFIGPEVLTYLKILPFIDDEKINNVINAHQTYGNLIIFLGAFTPLPFKIICFTSGIFQVDIINFLLMSLVGRGLRFLTIAWLVKKYGESAIFLIKKHFFVFTLMVGICIFLVVILIK